MALRLPWSPRPHPGEPTDDEILSGVIRCRCNPPQAKVCEKIQGIREWAMVRIICRRARPAID